MRRFLQPDPIGYFGGMNLYAYVGNDPVSMNDPYGLWTRGFDFSFTTGTFVGPTFGVTWLWDDRGNMDVFLHGGGGLIFGSTIGTLSVQIQETDADDIYDLLGSGGSWGGSTPTPVLAATGELFRGNLSCSKKSYTGHNSGISIGQGGSIMHVMVEGTWRPRFKAWDRFVKWVKSVEPSEGN
jgi:hypothetical protein